jgi:hypothetical protein
MDVAKEALTSIRQFFLNSGDRHIRVATNLCVSLSTRSYAAQHRRNGPQKDIEVGP